MRIGHGYDVHRLTENRRLVLCGVEIPLETQYAMKLSSSQKIVVQYGRLDNRQTNLAYYTTMAF